MKTIWLDMDGTIADFYGVKNWLTYLQNEDPTPYRIAKGIVNLNHLANLLNRLRKKGYQISIVSWCAKNATTEFNDEVKEAKLSWLSKHLPSVYFTEIAILPYGTPKSTVGNGILFDDEKPNLAEWKDISVNAKYLIPTLKSLL